ARIWRVVRRELVLAALLLLLLEIAARRLQLWGGFEALLERLLGRWRWVRTASLTPKPASVGSMEPSVARSAAPPSAPSPTAQTEGNNLDEALARARRSARRELDR
ncbi:MAG: hypothetical protein ACKO4Q_13600, partial [Planctomycetota bacterium]